jgi:hypothetical protein
MLGSHPQEVPTGHREAVMFAQFAEIVNFLVQLDFGYSCPVLVLADHDSVPIFS